MICYGNNCTEKKTPPKNTSTNQHDLKIKAQKSQKNACDIKETFQQ